MAVKKPYFIVRWNPPAEVAKLPRAERLRYWTLAAEQVLRQKDRDLANGLAADGKPLGRPSERWLRRRRSAMTPDGKGDPSAPLFQPGRGLSRVRSLLKARGYDGYVRVWWAFDPTVGDEWGVVLAHWAAAKGPRWDVLGMPPASIGAARRAAGVLWGERTAGPDGGVNNAKQAVRSAHVSTFPRVVSRPRTLDLHAGTSEEIARASAEGRFSGWMTPDQLDRFWREGRQAPRNQAAVVRSGIIGEAERTWKPSPPSQPRPTAGFLRRLVDRIFEQFGV